MATWGQTPDVYTLPEVRLTSTGAPWLADAAVVSWQVERELVGSTLPGNIRARSGLSIGDASVVVAVESGTLTPWSRDTARRVTVDAAARLFVEADDGDQLDLGAWLISPTSGNLTSRETQVDLTEAQYVGRGEDRSVKQALPPRGLEALPVDPAWMIARLAEQVGYRLAPLPVAGETFLDLPLDGAFDGRGFAGASVDGLDGWAVLSGDVLVGTSGDGNLTTTPAPTAAETWKAGGSVYLTLNVVGEMRVLDVAQEWKVVVDAAAGTVAVRNGLSGAVVSTSFTPGLSADWPTRVQVEIQRDFTLGDGLDLLPGTWTAMRVRARSAPDAAWSSWAEDTADRAEANRGIATTYFLVGQDYDGVTVTPADPGQIAAVQLSASGPSEALWAGPATVHLKPLGGQVQIPYAPPADDVWTTIQNVAGASLAAVHPDRDGIMQVLDRDDLAGANTTGAVTLIDEEWTDLGWTLDPADAADRLEVSALVPAIQETTATATSTPAPELWRAEEVIEVPPGGKLITLNVEVDGKAGEGVFTTFVTPQNLVDDPTLASRFSVVCHATGRDGSGALTSTDFAISAVALSPSRLQLRFRNSGSAPLYLVDANGEPCVIVRAWRVATFDTPRLTARGAAAETAVRPLPVDLGPFVQQPDDLEDVADYLWARVGGAPSWKASSVRCRLDWSHDIGKVLRLVHARTGLEEKALITKVAYAGSAGEIEQTLDLVRLPWTWSDFDSTYASMTWNQWDALWATSTWDEHDADPLSLGG